MRHVADLRKLVSDPGKPSAAGRLRALSRAAEDDGGERSDRGQEHEAGEEGAEDPAHRVLQEAELLHRAANVVTAQEGAHLEVFFHRHGGEDVRGLRHEGHALGDARLRGKPGDVLAVDDHVFDHQVRPAHAVLLVLGLDTQRALAGSRHQLLLIELHVEVFVDVRLLEMKRSASWRCMWSQPLRPIRPRASAR